MTVPYTKSPLAVPDQVTLLQSRGMTIADPQAAIKILEQVGYYRFSGYALPWRQPTGDNFRPGISFEDVWNLYEFDRRLRDLLWEGIEAIEITLRTRMTLRLTLHYQDPFAHTNPRHVQPNLQQKHAEWLTRLDTEAQRSKDLSIQHFRKTYDGFPRLPMWVANEVMSFGALSQLFSMLRSGDQAAIARGIGLHERYLPSWIHALSVVRNACAHHARCWDRLWDITPTLPFDNAWNPFYVINGGQRMVEHRVGVLVFIIYRLLVAMGHPVRTDWRTRTRSELSSLHVQWSPSVGLHPNWLDSTLWNE